MDKAKWIAGAVLAVVLMVFTLQNAQAVQVSFLFWSFSLSLVVLIVILLASGAALGWLACARAHRRRGQG